MRTSLLLLFAVTSLSSAHALSKDLDMDFGKRPPTEVYRIIKTAVRDSIEEELLFNQQRLKEKKTYKEKPYLPPPVYDIGNCFGVYVSSAIATENGPQRFAIEIAATSHILERDLDKKFRIPRSVWGTHIAELDQIGVDAIASTSKWSFGVPNDPGYSPSHQAFSEKKRRATEALHRSLLKYRAQKKGNPAFEHEGGCGAGEEEQQIVGNAALVTFSYVPYYNYRVCQLLDINPEEFPKCIGWETRRFSGPVVKFPKDPRGPLDGFYHFVAKLPGGVVKRGEFFAQYPYSQKEVVQIDLR